MAPGSAPKPFIACEGSPNWSPTTYIVDTALHERAAELLSHDDLQSAIALSFSLPPRDAYTYHAIVSVKLPEAQHVISLGAKNGLHAWYRALRPPPTTTEPTPPGEPSQAPKKPPALEALPPPPPADIEAYLSIFSPATVTASALKTLGSNAKKGSLRAQIASYLSARRFLHPGLPALVIPRNKKQAPPNPYLAFLAWSCRNLEWAGPCAASEAVRSSHHVLPVLMHHFGCACPSYEALEALRVLAASRDVVDMGSGGGYWSFMLRLHGVRAVPVDSAQSAWRVTWVQDTEIADGEAWLRRRDGGRAAVLLLVYPIVGGGVAGGQEGGFTRGMLKAYRGDTLAVVGTQNRNGYTGFRGMSMDEYMERDHKEWTKVLQIPLPSFAGKDEALFVFQRGERAPKPVDTDKDKEQDKDASSKKENAT